MDDRHIREWIRFACERNEVPELAQVIFGRMESAIHETAWRCRLQSITFRARIRLEPSAVASYFGPRIEERR